MTETLLLNAVVKEFLAAQDIPGALVSVSAGNQRLLYKAYGLARLEESDACDTSTEMVLADHSLVGSVTKSMVCYVISLLVTRKQLSWEDTLSRWFPALPYSAEVTIFMLTNMTSGIPSYSLSPAFRDVLINDPYHQFSPIQLIKYAYALPYLFPPGTAYFYSNTNTVLLGLIIERLYRQCMSTIMQQEIFTPFGMHSSLFSSGLDRQYPLADGYDLDPDEGLVNTTLFNISWTFTAGAVVSNLKDLTTWAKVLGTQPDLSAEVKAMRYNMATVGMEGSPGIVFTENFYYGVGLVVDNGWTYHNGSVPGYDAIAAHIAVEGKSFSVAILLNKSHESHGNLASKLFVRIARVITPDNVPQHIAEKNIHGII